MPHAPFILASYALGVAVPVWLGVEAWTRGTAARRRLAALDTRRRPAAPGLDRSRPPA